MYRKPIMQDVPEPDAEPQEAAAEAAPEATIPMPEEDGVAYRRPPTAPTGAPAASRKPAVSHKRKAAPEQPPEEQMSQTGRRHRRADSDRKTE